MAKKKDLECDDQKGNAISSNCFGDPQPGRQHQDEQRTPALVREPSVCGKEAYRPSRDQAAEGLDGLEPGTNLKALDGTRSRPARRGEALAA